MAHADSSTQQLVHNSRPPSRGVKRANSCHGLVDLQLEDRGQCRAPHDVRLALRLGHHQVGAPDEHGGLPRVLADKPPQQEHQRK